MGESREGARLAAVQDLLKYEGREEYSRVQVEVAERLGLSVRSVQRMMRAWRESGLIGLQGRGRSDRGQRRISEEWQKFILTTYREGNRGGRQMSRSQVMERVKVRAQELDTEEYPSHTTVYRILKPLVKRQATVKRSMGWRGGAMVVKTREGIEITVRQSNQVWQVDHTKVDVLVVDRSGEIIGRPWLTIVVDMHSRCIMGLHLGFDAPSADVVCLALRHAILAKQYPARYELEQSWGTYGLPQYLYTDGGKDFRSQHIEQVANQLGIVLCLRRRPSDGGIVERPFGTFNSELFSGMPGYTGSNVQERSPVAEREANLTLMQLEQLLVRYIVDRYNHKPDHRIKNQSRMGLWEAGRIGQLALLGPRDLDMCLMRRERRTVYRSGYIQFATLTYQGEHLAGYAGESVVVRYDPRDITTIWIYQLRGEKEEFLTRAHAQGLETEIVSYSEAQAMSRRIRESGKALSNRSILNEVRERDAKLQQLRRQGVGNARDSKRGRMSVAQRQEEFKQQSLLLARESSEETAAKDEHSIKSNDDELKKQIKPVRVYANYEEIEREARENEPIRRPRPGDGR